MKHRTKTWAIVCGATVALALLAAGSQAQPAAGKTPSADIKITKADEKIVIKQADVNALKQSMEAYWQFRIKNNYTKAFDFEDPDTKTKYKIDLEEYLSSKSRVEYHSTKLQQINFMRPDYVQVTMLVKYTFEWTEKMTDEKDLLEKWVKRKDGKWYRLFTTNMNQQMLEG